LSDSPTISFAATVALFRDIAIFRRGPADLPVSWGLLLLTIVAQAIMGWVIGAILPPLPTQADAPDHSLALLLIDVVVVLLWGWVILQFAAKSERFVQTMTAVFGCQLVMQPLLAPAVWAVGFYGKESSWSLPMAALLSALSVWTLMVMGRVLRAATDWSMFPCLALVLGQGLLTYLVSVVLFPDLLK
jgi:hypothetical protein